MIVTGSDHITSVGILYVDGAHDCMLCVPECVRQDLCACVRVCVYLNGCHRSSSSSSLTHTIYLSTTLCCLVGRVIKFV